mgnify:CR=1 FL=1
MDYGAVMGKSLNLALLLTVSLPAVAYAVSAAPAEKAPATASSGIYKLDEEKAASAAVSKAAGDAVSSAAPIAEEETDQPKIIKEEISGGHIEKLVAPDGKVIAEKTIKDGEVVKKVLNYYHPNGQVSRKVTTLDDGKGFYAEDYYMNGRLAAQATYLNENNKIGTEKKYDNNGTLRQEIPWVLPKEDAQKPLAEQKTIRQGNIITYYPDGRIAASFPVGQEDGKTLFFNRQGRVIKEVENARVLNFAPELDAADCQDKVVKLSLEELVELYEDEGDISYNKCGLPYRENFVYEIADMRGNAVSKISYDDTGMIRRITPYVGGLKNGVEQKFDASGNLTAEINYKQGIKNGTASGFFPTKEVAFRKRYEDGKVVGRLTCYFPTGEVAAEFAYKDGKKEGTAKIYGPNAREISFAGGEIVGAAPKDARRAPEPSKLAALSNPDSKCLDITSKLDELALDLEANANTVTKAFALDLPDSCRDFSSFKPEKSNYACYDVLNRLRAVFPTGYNRGEYAIETVYAENGQHLYDIPYYQKQKQGFAKKFDDKGHVVAEIYYSRDKLAESSRSYHENGAVKEMLTIADGAPRKLLVRYNKDGTLAFSLNYNEGEKTDAFLAEPQKNKDIYLKFFEDVLEVNEEINVSFVQDYLTRLNENIDYYLKENNEQRKYNYQREVKRCLKNIALTTVRNVMDLKRNMDNTYKNEPNYKIKKTKLVRLDEKRNNIALLIRKSEELIDYGQPVFFRVAMDVQMRNVVSDVKLQLNDSYHNLIEIQKQIIHYLNLIDYQNRIFEKVKKLKYLKDQFLLEEHTSIRSVAAQKNPVWMEPQVGYRIKLSIDNLRTSDEAFQILKKLVARQRNSPKGMKQLADAIPEGYLDGQSQMIDTVNLQEVHNSFMASSTHLFSFVMNYRYRKEVTRGEKLIFFCQLASQYADELRFTDTYEISDEVEYPLIYAK